MSPQYDAVNATRRTTTHRDNFVQKFRFAVLGDEASANSLDLMGRPGTPRQHRRLLGLHRDDANVCVFLLEIAGGTWQGQK